ncbi:MAG: hypothetical protein RLZZ04_383 [Cyanobacteriota bacterium]|jgi:hypothetical protein
MSTSKGRCDLLRAQEKGQAQAENKNKFSEPVLYLKEIMTILIAILYLCFNSKVEEHYCKHSWQF